MRFRPYHQKMVGSSLRRVTMDDYDTEVQPGNQLAKASHIERGTMFTPATALHRFTGLFISKLNFSFPISRRLSVRLSIFQSKSNITTPYYTHSSFAGWPEDIYKREVDETLLTSPHQGDAIGISCPPNCCLWMAMNILPHFNMGWEEIKPNWTTLNQM